jgi:hypothetical protein
VSAAACRSTSSTSSSALICLPDARGGEVFHNDTSSFSSSAWGLARPRSSDLLCHLVPVPHRSRVRWNLAIGPFALDANPSVP